jgi:hypothetical protein
MEQLFGTGPHGGDPAGDLGVKYWAPWWALPAGSAAATTRASRVNADIKRHFNGTPCRARA